MAIPLKQSTASQEILLGPFLDDTDGKTAETALTIANTDIQIWKAGGTTEASKNSGGATHIASGRYYAVLDATDTDTLGPMEINVHVTGALPVRRECIVYAANIFDALFGGTDLIDVSVTQLAGTAIDQSAGLINANVKQISTDAVAADNLEAALDGTGGVTISASLSSTGNNAIADAALTRDLDQVEASAPVHSLAVAGLKAVSRTRNNAGTLETYQTDGVTLKLSQVLTTDSSANPIKEVGLGS